MKTAIVISDTHRNFPALEKLLPKMLENDYVFHLGDNDGDILSYRKELGDKIYSVKGNCDGGGADQIIEIEGVKILLTHGDLYGAKQGLDRLYYRAKELGADIVVYGHTHFAGVTTEDDILFINPGNLSKFSTNKSFGYLVINDKKATATINYNFFKVF